MHGPSVPILNIVNTIQNVYVHTYPYNTAYTMTIAVMGIRVYLLNGRNVIRRLKKQLF